jgi:hypothetical protein
LRPEIADFLCDCREAVRRTGCENQLCLFARESQRDFPADALRRSSDEDDFILKIGADIKSPWGLARFR